MAKLENKASKLVKSKAKKRKHVEDNEEMEVANKSLIVEAEKEEAINATVEKKGKKEKAQKRKHPEKGNIEEKRRRRSEELSEEEREVESVQNELHQTVIDSKEVEEGDVGDNDGETNKTLTLEELQESEKLQNSLASKTMRQKKKQKHQQRLETLKDQLADKEKLRNEDYLRRWKSNRSDWKFEKLRQISIQQCVFNNQKIGDEVFGIAVEYLSGSKGAAKDKITKLAEDIINKLDAESAAKQDEQERQAVIDSAEYQRARELLQSFE